MPRRKKGKRQGRKMPNPTRVIGDSITVPFSNVLQFSAVGSAATNINPTGLGVRILQMAEAWELYRVVRMRYRIRRESANTVAVAFAQGITDTGPSTLAQILTMSTCTYVTLVETLPSPWKNLTSKDLAGYTNWYKTIVGTPDTSVEIQGTLYCLASGTSTWDVEIEGVIQFRGAIDPGNTPAMRLKAQYQQEYARIQKILVEGAKYGLTPGNKPVTSGGLMPPA